MKFKRSALVLYRASEMYRLVHDVAAYPEFLNWCTAAEVHQQTYQEQLASLTVSVSGIVQTITTRNRLVRDERLSMSLVKGPFRSFQGDWEFIPLGEQGSKVTLQLAFNFSSSLMSSAFRRGFAHIADRLVQDFCRRAEQVYGGG